MKATAKRRRSKLEIQEDKRREEQEKAELRNKIQEVQDLQNKVEAMNGQIGLAATLHN